MSIFKTTPQWQTAYPDAHIGILAMEGLENPRHHPGLASHKTDLETRLRASYGDLDRPALRQLPTLQAYSAYYKRFKKTYHVQLQLESIIWKGRNLPQVTALVDIMFMAELDNLLLTAGHDLDKVTPPAYVTVAEGNENYKTMRGEEKIPKAGDMFIADSEGILSNIIYGPDQRSAITGSTSRVLYTVYGTPGIQPEQVSNHLTTLRELVLLVSPQGKTIEEKVYS
jgi:DNA/RNA-binding domain of Phe-tRNA-synthetase-like protein